MLEQKSDVLWISWRLISPITWLFPQNLSHGNIKGQIIPKRQQQQFHFLDPFFSETLLVPLTYYQELSSVKPIIYIMFDREIHESTLYTNSTTHALREKFSVYVIRYSFIDFSSFIGHQFIWYLFSTSIYSVHYSYR